MAKMMQRDAALFLCLRSLARCSLWRQVIRRCAPASDVAGRRSRDASTALTVWSAVAAVAPPGIIA